jgi:V/A-type H+-transporting ATPase subunit I
MITKMKKLTLFLAQDERETDKEIRKLGELGVLHVTPFQTAKDESITRVDARIKQLEKAIRILDTVEVEEEDVLKLDAITDYSKMERGEILLLEEILDLDNEIAHLKKKVQSYTEANSWYETWGDISTEDIDDLAKKGVYVRLFELGDNELKKLDKDKHIHITGQKDGVNYVAYVTDDIEDSLSYEEVQLPEYKNHELMDLFVSVDKELVAKQMMLDQLAEQKQLLVDALEERQQRLDVRNVQFGGLPIERHLNCLSGYIPEDAIEHFVEEAEKNEWGYIIDEPAEEEIDEVPTLVKTSSWSKTIKPVMNFMGLVPGYKELDVSKVFMIFFTFFSGILVGDAGYGLVFLLITLLVHRGQKFARKVEFDLMYTLSASIMVWGTLTGTYFGSEAIANIPVLSALRVDAIASFGGDSLFIQKFMFLIGAIHLSIGHLQIAYRYLNSVKAISEIGWVSIIWGLFFLVNQMVLGIEAPSYMIWMFVGGIVLIALFSNPGKSFFKGMLSSLGNLPLSIINGFSDLISYIRLYAVGLSTVLMATSFNQMAIGDGISTIASGVAAVVVLILGHGLNMVLAAMAILVHGVRLNMLEYAGHAGVEFSGNEYNPFRLKNKESQNKKDNK